jgi:hypothetical protein
MADLSDVEQAIADLITAVLYPAGNSQASAIGPLCRVYRGWPNANALNTDLGLGAINITIVPDNDSGQVTTRHLSDWEVQRSEPGTLLQVMNNTILVTGKPTVGDVVGALIDHQPFVYRVGFGDTVDLVASALGRLIQSKFAARISGSLIAVEGTASITVRSVCDQKMSRAGRRQQKDIRIIFWCPNPSVRDRAVSIVDASLGERSFLGLADNVAFRLTYKNTSSYDQAQNALLYRRDLIYTVEYPTTITIRAQSMLFGASDLNQNITYN